MEASDIITVTVPSSTENEASESNISIFEYVFYIKIVLLVIGIPGNIMCIYIMRQKTFKEMARSYICITLAIADSGFLILDGIRGIFFYITQWEADYLTTSIITCKLNNPFIIYVVHLDAWMIVFLSVERLIAIFR